MRKFIFEVEGTQTLVLDLTDMVTGIVQLVEDAMESEGLDAGQRERIVEWMLHGEPEEETTS